MSGRRLWRTPDQNSVFDCIGEAGSRTALTAEEAIDDRPTEWALREERCERLLLLAMQSKQ
jgi:hypothetical protein